MKAHTAAAALMFAAVLAPTAVAVTAHRSVDLAGTGLVMGGTFQPTPGPEMLHFVEDRFDPDHLYTMTPLTTPAGILGDTYPRGMDILINAINTHNPADPLLVFGISQSAGIIGMALDSGQLHFDGDLHFIALAPSNFPNTGLFVVPKYHDLMTWLYGEQATQPFTADSEYPVDVYCGQYDPFCDQPTQAVSGLWANWLVSSNSRAAGGVVHGSYLNTPADYFDHAVLIDSDGNTNFYMIPAEHLPILQGRFDFAEFVAQWFPNLGRQMFDQLNALEAGWRPIIDAAYPNFMPEIPIDMPVDTPVDLPDLAP